ncbi:MAG: dethiobiotin synthase [Pyrinomonadaceae bacterium]
MRGIFVTGTDTGIGKTVVSAALVCAWRSAEKVCYWKPVQTGIEEDDDTATVRKLAACSVEEIFDRGFRLEKPLSPHLSARLAGVEIGVGKILQFAEKIPEERFLIVEGAGGLLVPLNEEQLMIDLIRALGLPVLIVARSSLGTINHTLLTVESLRRRDLKISGIVLVGEPNAENKKAIEHFSNVPVLAEMPKFEKLNERVLKNWSEENRSRLQKNQHRPR